MIIDVVQYSAILNISTSGVRVETLQQVMIVVSGSYYSIWKSMLRTENMLLFQIIESIATIVLPNTSASIFEVKLLSENTSR